MFQVSCDVSSSAPQTTQREENELVKYLPIPREPIKDYNLMEESYLSEQSWSIVSLYSSCIFNPICQPQLFDDITLNDVALP